MQHVRPQVKDRKRANVVMFDLTLRSADLVKVCDFDLFEAN
jgi:hypothetical protein